MADSTTTTPGKPGNGAEAKLTFLNTLSELQKLDSNRPEEVANDVRSDATDTLKGKAQTSDDNQKQPKPPELKSASEVISDLIKDMQKIMNLKPLKARALGFQERSMILMKMSEDGRLWIGTSLHPDADPEQAKELTLLVDFFEEKRVQGIQKNEAKREGKKGNKKEKMKERDIKEIAKTIEKIPNTENIPALRALALGYQKKKMISLTIDEDTKTKHWIGTKLHDDADPELREDIQKLIDVLEAQKALLLKQREAKQEERMKRNEEREKIEARINEAIEKVNQADRKTIEKDSEGNPIPGAPDGVIEICQPLVDDGYLRYNPHPQKDDRSDRPPAHYTVSPARNYARPLALAANKRIQDINEEIRLNREFNYIRKQNGGFAYDIDGDKFAFRLAKAGEKDGQDIVKVVELLVVRGKAPFTKGTKPYKEWHKEVREAYKAFQGDEESLYPVKKQPSRIDRPARPAKNRGAQKEDFTNRPRKKEFRKRKRGSQK